MEKAGSFSKNKVSTGNESDQTNNIDEIASDSSLAQAMDAVDGFLETVSSAEEEIPRSVESFPNIVDSMISKYESSSKFGKNQEDDSLFIDALNAISRLVTKLREFPSDSPLSLLLNCASSVQHHAISLLDEELRYLLDHPKRNRSKNNSNHGHSHSGSSNSNSNVDHIHKGTPKTKRQGSFKKSNDPDRCLLSGNEAVQEEETFPYFPAETISSMNKIASTMMSAGYEAECCLAYEISRRHAFKDELVHIGCESINVEDVQRMHWESLEEEIAAWISVVRHCSTALLPGERKLCEAVFSGFPCVSRRLFAELATAVTIRFMDFSGAVVLTKRTTEKLFKFLDMYEALRDLIPAVDESARTLTSEIKVAQSRLGEAAVSIFSELENSIKSDNGRTPVPSGAVHPLTRYTMNYLKYACEYKDTLEQVFQQKTQADQADGGEEPESKKSSDQYDDRKPNTSPFAVQLMSVMDLLDANLDTKSKLYRDPSLRYIFLMNNGRYILQKIKGSQEIHEIMGASWTRKRSSDLRQYHKSYQRETWSRLLHIMSHEGLQVNGKVSKQVLKERFKNFNTLFDDIHKTQTTWVVSDEQLQSELRVSISAVVIPAYRSFLGRFKQHLDGGRQTEKYIKYQPEDIETLIDELFDGNPASMNRRRM